MNEEMLLRRIESLEKRLNEQQDEIDKLNKKTKRYKWLILASLFDK